ncbi:Coenzyme F420-dependent N5,N10-methenyltetrahydromethanopterin reductase [Striga asiatica]|uniref:Coenzyme F420-dependent N5,N10-methenyltetrahydromethanopterin reductase n=1 Tax=Striga asiatica TaxID=4170 RepID=A0A5A7Q314_STRAF|nr:Coenzyme F420-dependent N5,N10-methenyltetrahydromethanopterin reductase [Striga asiatica]
MESNNSITIYVHARASSRWASLLGCFHTGPRAEDGRKRVGLNSADRFEGLPFAGRRRRIGQVNLDFWSLKFVSSQPRENPRLYRGRGPLLLMEEASTIARRARNLLSRGCLLSLLQPRRSVSAWCSRRSLVLYLWVIFLASETSAGKL